MSKLRRPAAIAGAILCGFLSLFMGLAILGMLSIVQIEGAGDAPTSQIVFCAALALLFAWLTRKCWVIRNTTAVTAPIAKPPLTQPVNKASKPHKQHRKEDDYHDFFSKIYGTSQRNRDGTSRQAAIRKHCYPSAQLDLIREPQNKHDSNAIAVFYNDSQLGYLSADIAGQYASDIDTGKIKLSASIEDITGGTGDGKTLGVNITIRIEDL